VELDAPGRPLRREQVRLSHDGLVSSWFPWAYVGADDIADVVAEAGLGDVETWSIEDRWFACIQQ
jgi:hypothetical protein